ncbi:uncharacterized protein EI97DRAFT_190524 [Westerdykella ornata]|uniref:N-acetyltransferase domain-containing protein n=1 Tax=Westerdykella ornata TaxID=318751 RepID=A0A6A6J979_WESOR|nr:uncharacterized protein EI97DRAFT_190524 [Westerdykella ornata]KAF2273130.1 hypothetical protein EI97DRAFT_190524 [Westerdykella ornata]
MSTFLSHPILYSAASLCQDQELAVRLMGFINDAFQRAKQRDPQKWDPQKLRFGSEAELFEMLGENGVMAVVYDQNESRAVQTDNGLDVGGRGKIVACAAAVQWKGIEREAGKDPSYGDEFEKTEIEEGWEIKTVCVSADSRYAKKGLAVRVCDFLQEYLVKQVYEATNASEKAIRGHLVLWIITAESMNGEYWRRRGYRDVMKRVIKPPVWGSKAEFVMVVLRKDITWEK